MFYCEDTKQEKHKDIANSGTKFDEKQKLFASKIKNTLKHFVGILAVLVLVSCQLFDQKVPDADVLLKKELKAINWKEVDEYPSFAECNSLENKVLQKKCFFEYLQQLIQERISTDTLAVLYPELDTIEVKVTVLPNAKLEFAPFFKKDSVSYDTVKVDSILRVRLVNFPKVNPAIKRGVPVKTQFILPVIIKVTP